MVEYVQYLHRSLIIKDFAFYSNHTEIIMVIETASA